MDQTKSDLLSTIENLKLQQERTLVKLKFLQEELPKLRAEIETLKQLLAGTRQTPGE